VDLSRANGKFSLRTAVAIVAVLNLAYFGIEFTVALRIGSIALFADSIDFLEDTSINFLILATLTWSLYKRSLVGMLLAMLLLVPGAATLWMTWQKFGNPVPPDAVSLSVTGTGALVVNVTCALILAAFKRQANNLARAAYLSARNDAIANIAIIVAGFATGTTGSVWPDVLAGLGIFAINADAAREVFTTARRERIEARA
jgi:Co/Zn/Cd efflux system component